jgi:hypothetical protein
MFKREKRSKPERARTKESASADLPPMYCGKLRTLHERGFSLSGLLLFVLLNI